MDRLFAMRVFTKVAAAKGFAEAARQLHMSAPAVTRAVAGLEDAIGARLFVRTTRAVALTEAGERFYEDCVRILADIAEAEALAAGSFSRPSGVLTVTAPVMFGHQYVLPIVLDYLTEYPDMTVRTLFVDRIVNLIDEGVDLAVRVQHLPDSSLSATRIGAMRRVVCGAPRYLDERGIPDTPAQLAEHTIIAPVAAWTSVEWRFGRDQRTVVHVRPRLFCNTNEAAMKAAIAGWGLTRLLSYQIAPSLSEGTLRTVLSSFEETPLPIHVVYPDRRHAPAKVRSFADFATERLRANELIG